MGENEYKDNEKVLYETKGKLTLPHKKPEEVNLFATEDHLVIEAEEPIKILLSRIKDCNVAIEYPSFYYSTESKEPLSGTLTLTFLDDVEKKKKLSLEMHIGSLHLFKESINEQTAKHIKPMKGKYTAAITVLFVIFLVLGILLLMLSSIQEGDTGLGWGLLAGGFYSLLLAVILLPFLIVFRKRTGKGAESVYDEGTESTNKHMEKT